ncbi:OsmC family peroxiredoxin [Pedobacter sp. HMF7647]|uniref:OsmC family peroxiredoxin n=1 Tax=Hufsiella arboris TaxID=2695275 RepID=A0A7K1YCR1_9SPHI|nr:OsmC family protein [Hufsiella arboris]MXV52355.1 OsmC family peroxiredoxin [Hufsiella arboris]
MTKQHEYKTTVKWTGNKGEGTVNYRTYERSHTVSIINKADILCSSDPSFRGDPTRYNPEELLVASLSSCHMLWYLHLCSEAGVIVTAYEDNATGIMLETANGGGHFKQVILHPHVTVKDQSMKNKANELHHQANKLCFIANSCNFPVKHEPVCDSD